MKMCQAFAVNGHDVTLYAIQDEGVTDIFGYYGVKRDFVVEQFRYPRGRQLGNYLYSWQIRRAVGRTSLPDLFYGRHLMSLWLLSGIARPMCYEVHNVPSSRFKAWQEGSLFQKKNFKQLVCISEALREEYLRRFPSLLINKVVVAHDGADVPDQHGCEAGLELKRGRSGLRVGYVGHLYAGKGMEVIRRLAERLPLEIFHIVGGTEEDIACWRGKSPHNVIFHGFVPPAMLAPYFCSFDIVLAPLMRKVSVSGGGGDIARFTSPLKLFEYMAFGKTIICSDLPVLREFLSDRKNAWLCSPDRIEDWVSALETLAVNPGLRERLATTAREDFLGKYTWRARAKSVLGKFESTGL